MKGKPVLDLGCGDGYGVELLGLMVAEAVGLDLAPEAIYHARREYSAPHLRFDYGDVYQLPYQEGSFDVVTSLQVVEHLHHHDRDIGEMRRVLKPAGTAILITPNRLVISPGQHHPVCPFHILQREAGYIPLPGGR